MRNPFNRFWLPVSLIALLANVAFPAVGAVTAQTHGKSTVSAYNRLPSIAMGQFGADSTALGAQDLVIPLLTRVDAPLVAQVPWTVATVSASANGSQTFNPASAPAISANSASSRLPQSSPGAATAATMMLIAFFLFRRTQ